MKQEIFSTTRVVNEDGCFNLQFRKDTRKERTNAPTYYRWKTQFVVTLPKNDIKLLEKIKKEMGCGSITVSKNQARFSVQKLGEISDSVIPYFTKNKLMNDKKKDFEVWCKAVEILQRNKGKALLSWKKNELNSLMEIHKLSSKYKKNSRTPKWLDMAKSFSKSGT
jgi:hypothetical protein